jgi:hypothetical protein
MKKSQVVKIGIQMIALFLLIKHIDVVVSTTTFANQLFQIENKIDKTVLLYGLFERLLYLCFLVVIIINSEKLAKVFLTKNEQDDIVISIKENELTLLGIILILGISFIQSISEIILESYYYFNTKVSNNYDEIIEYRPKNLLIAITKVVISTIAFFYRNALNKYFHETSKK